MVQSRALLVSAVIIFSCMSVSAQTGPCVGGNPNPSLFSLVLGNPVRLSFADLSQAILFSPSVTIVGNDISVVQLASDANQYPLPTCNSQSISLGALPPGSYTVTWNYQLGLSHPPIYFESFRFVFSVPGPAPCSPGVTLQPGDPVADQPVSIDYFVPFRGFLQTPSVAIDGSQITIDQPSVIADPAFPGNIPCGQGHVQVGFLQVGAYHVVVRPSSSSPMSVSFVVRPATVTVCGFVSASSSQVTGPASGTHGASVTVSGDSVRLHFENHAFAEFVGGGWSLTPLLGAPLISIDGYKIEVVQRYVPAHPGPIQDSGPGVYDLYCQSEDVDLGALGPGKYSLIWTYVTNEGPVSVATTFNNGTSARGRAVRGH